MTRKDFEAIAKIIRDSDLCWDDRWNLSNDFCHMLSDQNDRFNRELFLRACDCWDC